jgi:vitamin B12 transporter
MTTMHHTRCRSASPRLFAHSALVVALATVSTALAAETAPIEPVLVTSSRLPEPPPGNVTAIDRVAIEQQRGADVLDLLRIAPGISSTRPGGAGGITEIFLRGAESNFTTVLIDGVRVTDPSNPRGGGYDFSTLNGDEIERIEIARGALSAVHGSDAMAGVINIVTRRPSNELTANVRVEGGSDHFQRASALLSGPINNALRGSVKASYADWGDAVEGSTQRLSTAQADVEYGSVQSGIGLVRGGIRYAERDRRSYPDASGGPLHAVLRDTETAHANERAAWAQTTRQLSSAWTMDVTASYFSRHEDTDSPAIAPGVFDAVPATVSDSRFQRGQVTISHRYDVSSRLQLGGGVDLQREDGERTGSLDLGFAQMPSNFDLDRSIRALYAEARYDVLDALTVFGAVRVDDSSEDSARTSGRLAASYAIETTGTRFHASWSNGHKQPSFYSLGDTLVGNPDLKVETSETVEVGIEQRLLGDRLSAAVTAFRSSYDDLIDFDFATFRLVNRARADIDGIEAALNASVGATLTMRVHATVSDIELRDPQGGADATLLYRPERYGGLQIAWQPFETWSLHGQVQHVGSRAGSAVPTGALTLNSYERVDVALSHDVRSLATLFLAVDNVLDEDYQEAVGFPSAGRQFRVGAALKF